MEYVSDEICMLKSIFQAWSMTLCPSVAIISTDDSVEQQTNFDKKQCSNEANLSNEKHFPILVSSGTGHRNALWHFSNMENSNMSQQRKEVINLKTDYHVLLYYIKFTKKVMHICDITNTIKYSLYIREFKLQVDNISFK